MDPRTAPFDFELPENPLPERLQEYRLKKKFTDVTIKIGEEEFAAHKIVLEDSSPMLKAWLSNNWSPGSPAVCEFSEQFIDPEVMEDLLTFFYTSKVKLTIENAHSICVAAHFLSLPKLLAGGELFLSERVTPETVLDLFLLSDKLELAILQASCVKCFFENYEAVLKDPKLIGFSLENIQMIMRVIDEPENDLKYKESLFESLITWVEHDFTNRSPVLPTLLRKLPLNELSKRFLLENVIPRQIISDSHSCLKLAMEALSAISFNNLPPSRALSKLYCFGGVNEKGNYLDSVSSLDISTGKWAQSASMPTPRAHFAAAVVDSKVYTFGGETANGAKSAAVEVFDCIANAWRVLEPMPEIRCRAGAVAYNQFIYIEGGLNSRGNCINTAVRYNLRTDQWEPIKAAEAASHYEHQLVELNGHLYTLGGNTKMVEKYSPQADTWTPVASMNLAHSCLAAVTLNGLIYVFSSAGFEVYSPDSNTWRELDSVLRNYSGRTLVAIKDKLYVLGGGKDKAREHIFEFDPATERWRQLPDMDIARQHHCSFFINP